MEEFSQHQKDLHNAIRRMEVAVAEINALTEGAEFGGLEEVLSVQEEWTFTNKVMAMQMLCQYLGHTDHFTEAERAQWLGIALEMGSDWVAKFRRIGSFMKLAVDA